MSAGVRWAGWVVLAVTMGVAAAILLERRAPLAERVLARAPENASIVAYTELGALRESRLLGDLVRRRLLEPTGFSIVEPELDAVAIAVGADEIVGLAAGRFPASLVQRYLETNGAICAGPLDEHACSLPAGERGGYLSMRALEPGLLGVTNGPRPNAADRLTASGTSGDRWAAEARAALDGGALVWISIDPNKLAETMSDPPEGWINLSLVARALLTATHAAVTLRDYGEARAVEARLEAACGSEADATELAKVLESLNELAATALRSGSAKENQGWARALDEGFFAESRERAVTARWLLPEDLLAEWLEAGQ